MSPTVALTLLTLERWVAFSIFSPLPLLTIWQNSLVVISVEVTSLIQACEPAVLTGDISAA